MEAENERTTTTIAIKLSTKEKIMQIGKMGESADDVINRALDALSYLSKRKVRKDGRLLE